MSTKSTIGSHKEFDTKVKNLVGEEMYKKFLDFGVKIKHIKKICIKIGIQKAEVFKSIFLKVCNRLVSSLEVMESQKISGGVIKKEISKIVAQVAEIAQPA